MTSVRPHARIATLCFVQVLVALEYSIVNVTLPDLAARMQVGGVDLQWVLSGYAVALGAGLLAGGRLADSAGLRRVLLVGLAGFAVTSFAAAVVPTFWMLVACRVGQGAFAALATPATTRAASHTRTSVPTVIASSLATRARIEARKTVTERVPAGNTARAIAPRK